MEIYGIVTTGFGKGRYFTELNEYKTQIKNQLNFTLFPGTLNIIINDVDNIYKIFSQLEEIKLSGFRDNDKDYGGCSCFNCTIDGIQCAIIIPEKTQHPKEILEIISSKNLRKVLGVKDGDIIKIKLNK